MKYETYMLLWSCLVIKYLQEQFGGGGGGCANMNGGGPR